VGIGAGVFLIAVGAILAFAVEYDIAGIELNVVGWILMGAGALALIMSLIVWGPRRRASREIITSGKHMMIFHAAASRPFGNAKLSEHSASLRLKAPDPGAPRGSSITLLAWLGVRNVLGGRPLVGLRPDVSLGHADHVGARL
jgi:hypothetical protein